MPTARTARRAAPRAETAFLPRSRVAVITGAAIGVLITAASAFRARTSSDFPWISLRPNLVALLLVDAALLPGVTCSANGSVRPVLVALPSQSRLRLEGRTRATERAIPGPEPSQDSCTFGPM